VVVYAITLEIYPTLPKILQMLCVKLPQLEMVLETMAKPKFKTRTVNSKNLDDSGRYSTRYENELCSLEDALPDMKMNLALVFVSLILFLPILLLFFQVPCLTFLT
ncbi:hypothetical protein PanWU01x14_297940, partial [Parasponia andersonii]